MGKIFYTSDLHLFHKNAIRFDERPWENVSDMHQGIIQRWNNKVSPEDTVYILGDVTWKNNDEAFEILRTLNGRKILLKGNHDRLNKEFVSIFDDVLDYLEINDGNVRVIMSHYPILFYNHQRHGAVHLYGHLHNTMDEQVCREMISTLNEKGIPCRAYNVGCMHWDFVPVTLEEVLQHYEH